MHALSPRRHGEEHVQCYNFTMDDDFREFQEVPEHLRLEDFETWLVNNALRSDEGDVPLDRQEALDRYEEHREYQRTLHARFFHKDNDRPSAVDQERLDTLQSFGSQTFRLIFAEGSDDYSANPSATSTTAAIIDAPLCALAESCETIYVAAARHKCTQLSLGHEFSFQAGRHVVNVLLHQSTVEETPEDIVVECCRLVSFLQNSTLLEQYAAILLSSVDTFNCLSLSQLAEQLNLPTLLERSLSHMMDSLEQMPQELLTKELRERITAIQSAIQSSVHHSQRSKLFFSSLDEYLAIFAERVQYYRERLAAAKEQRDELLHPTLHQHDIVDGTVGRFVTKPRDRFSTVSSHYMEDLQAKIERQEQRVRTLEIAFEEQKKLFGGKSNLLSNG